MHSFGDIILNVSLTCQSIKLLLMKIYLTTSIVLIILSLTDFIAPKSISAQTTKADTAIIYLKDFGLRNTKKKDCNGFINAAIKSLEPGKPTVLVFTSGEYHFYPEESNQRNYFESNTTDTSICMILIPRLIFYFLPLEVSDSIKKPYPQSHRIKATFAACQKP